MEIRHTNSTSDVRCGQCSLSPLMLLIVLLQGRQTGRLGESGAWVDGARGEDGSGPWIRF